MNSNDKGLVAIMLAVFGGIALLTCIGVTYSWHVSNQKVGIQIACIDAGMSWDSEDGECGVGSND